MGRGDETVPDHSDEGHSVDDPGVDDVLGRLTFKLSEQGGDGERPTRDDRSDVGVDELGELIAVGACEQANLGGELPGDRTHGVTS